MRPVGRASAALVAVSVVALPAAYRQRYHAELRAELVDIPKRQQVSYGLRVLVRSLALRSALTRYKPTIGEALMPAKRSSYDTSELRRRQSTGDIGHTVLGSEERVTAMSRWKLAAVPVVLVALGVILGLWGPVPGLGLFLLIGGMMACVPVAARLFNDLFS